jgi:hypothetical protein
MRNRMLLPEKVPVAQMVATIFNRVLRSFVLPGVEIRQGLLSVRIVISKKSLEIAHPSTLQVGSTTGSTNANSIIESELQLLA